MIGICGCILIGLFTEINNCLDTLQHNFFQKWMREKEGPIAVKIVHTIFATILRVILLELVLCLFKLYIQDITQFIERPLHMQPGHKQLRTTTIGPLQVVSSALGVVFRLEP